MKTVATLAVIFALLVLLAPMGLEVFIILSSIMAAVAFRAEPIISTGAFLTNFVVTMVHVPGFAYPGEFFQGQTILVHPENGIHWSLLALQVVVISITFYKLLKKGLPETKTEGPRPAFPAE
ncbi:MAG: hypothetical protein V3R20_02325 [Sphingomonadales bacterium]